MEELKSFLGTWLKFLFSLFLILAYPVGLLVGLYYSLEIWSNPLVVMTLYFLSVVLVLAIAFKIKFLLIMRNIHKVSNFGDN